MRFKYCLVFLVSCSTLLGMELEHSSKKKGIVLSLKEILLKYVAARVRHTLDSGNQLSWFDSAILPKELAAVIPRALSRYESEFAWRTIPCSVRCLRLTNRPSFIYNDTYFAVDNENKEMSVYHLQSNQLLGKLDNFLTKERKKTKRVGRFEVVYFEDSKLIRIWDLNSYELIFELVAEEDLSCLTISQNGDYIVRGFKDGQISITEIANPANTTSIKAHKSPIKNISISDGGTIMVIASTHACTAWRINYSAAETLVEPLLYFALNDFHDMQLTAQGRYLIITDGPWDNRLALRIFDLFERRWLYASEMKFCNVEPHKASSDSTLFFVPEGTADWFGNELDFTLVNLTLINAATGQTIKMFKARDLASSFQTEVNAFDISQDNNSILLYDQARNLILEISLDLKETLEDTLFFFTEKDKQSRNTWCSLV